MKCFAIAITVAIFSTGCASNGDPFCRGDRMCNIAMSNNKMKGTSNMGSPRTINQGYGVQVYEWGVPTGVTIK